MSSTYWIGAWTAGTKMIGNTPTAWVYSTNLSGYNSDGPAVDTTNTWGIQQQYALNKFLALTGLPPNTQVVALSPAEQSPWYVTLAFPLSPEVYPWDPVTGQPLPPLPGEGPVGGVGGPWAGDEDGPDLGGDGVDGTPASPPPEPRPTEGCEGGSSTLWLLGLPVTGTVTPTSNGMQAPLKVYEVAPQYLPSGFPDYSKPPIRTLIADYTVGALGLAPDGLSLPNNENVSYEAVFLPVTGHRTPPRANWGGGCLKRLIRAEYVALPAGVTEAQALPDVKFPGLLRDPVRVQLGEDQSGLFRDNRVSLTYVDGAPVTLSTPYRIGLETDPDTGVVGFELTSRRLDTTSGLVDWSGETVLGRLSREYPFPNGFFRGGPFTPREALLELLTAMRGEAGQVKREWLGWEEVPELYLWSTEGPVLPILEAIIIEEPQNGPGPSAQEVLRTFFEPFSGYGFRASQWSRLEVIPPPWLPKAASTVTAMQTGPGSITGAAAGFGTRLTWMLTSNADVGLLPSGRADLTMDWATLAESADETTGYRLRARRTGSGVELELSDLGSNSSRVMRATGVLTDPAEVLPPVLTVTDDQLQPGGTRTLDESQVVNVCTVTSQGYTWVDGVQVIPPATFNWGGVPTANPEAPPATHGYGQVIAPEGGALIAGTTLHLSIGLEGDAPDAFSGGRKGYGISQPVLVDLPAVDGASTTVRIDASAAWSVVMASVVLTLQYNAKAGGLQVTVDQSIGNDMHWAVTVSATGTAYQKSNTKVIGVYGESETTPDLAASRSTYGRREATLDTGVYQVTTATAVSMARAVVQARMNPREVTTYPQAPPYPVRPVHVGRRIATPDAVGVVTGWSYDEQHTPSQSGSNSAFTLSVEQPLIYRPQPLPDGTFTTPAGEDRYDVAQWDAAPLTP